MLPEYEPPSVQAGVLVFLTQHLVMLLALMMFLNFQQRFILQWWSSQERITLSYPHNADLGSAQPMSSDHHKVFCEAADHTTHRLADTWLEYAKHTGTVRDYNSVSGSQAQRSGTSSSLRC